MSMFIHMGVDTPSTPHPPRHLTLSQVSRLPMWEFLSTMRESGAAPPRSLVVSRCVHFAPFLQHICTYAQTASREAKACKTTTSFYVVLLTELVAAVPKVSEALVAQILPFLLSGLSKKASIEFQVSISVGHSSMGATLAHYCVPFTVRAMRKIRGKGPSGLGRLSFRVLDQVSFTHTWDIVVLDHPRKCQPLATKPPTKR